MLATILISALVTALVVIIHYEMLRLLSAAVPRMKVQSRTRVLYALLGALLAHVLEVLVFGLAYYAMLNTGSDFPLQFGQLYDLTGSTLRSFQDCSYYSFSTYTSLGLGDLYPVGYIRFLTGLEALTGLVLITWTASFMYMEMQAYWRRP